VPGPRVGSLLGSLVAVLIAVLVAVLLVVWVIVLVPILVAVGCLDHVSVFRSLLFWLQLGVWDHGWIFALSFWLLLVEKLMVIYSI